MTKYNEENEDKCEDCLYFNAILANILGACYKRRSNHFEHVITIDHPSCEFYEKEI